MKNKVNMWLNATQVSETDKDIIKNMSEVELTEVFGSDISFGTAGMRSKLGVGSNRMNTHTVAKATYGLGKYLSDNNVGDISVCVAYDSRYMSYEFSETIAQVLASFKIKTIIFDQVKPTPMLSFLVRNKKATAGIVITASHNPKDYNGYKVYNPSGAQLNLIEADAVINEINTIDSIFDYDFDCDYKDYVTYIGEDFDQTYIDSISDMSLNEERDVRVVFTPLHGTSGLIMPKALNHFGFNDIILVEEQMNPDPEFSNTTSANPEDIACYDLSLDYANKHNADLIIANDPDADRLGIMYLDNNGEYKALSGNQTGTLMIDYILNNQEITQNDYIYKTIVTGEMGAAIAKSRNVHVVELLTGFKFIGEQILINENNDKNYIFGYEESYGYLIKTIARDKDAIQASVLICEMVAYYKAHNITLGDKLNELYNTYGYYSEATYSIDLDGAQGLAKIKEVMKYVRDTEINQVLGIDVVSKLDYNNEIDDLPKADVVKFYLKDTGWFVFRPSGTEPKLKIYVSVKQDSLENAEKLNQDIFKEMAKLVK